jgi:hypothetical protein
MGKESPSPQNGEVPSGTALTRDAAASGRQRPEEILASTLSAAPHPEVTDGWSERGRRMFLLSLAAAGVILVIAGLLVTNELAPRSGTPAPVQTGPGKGVPDQLLQASTNGDAPPTPPASAPLALPLPASPATRPATTVAGPSPTPVAVTTPATTTNKGATPAPASPSPAPTTTVPCGGLVTRGLQAAQIQLPCGAGSSSPLGGL